MAEIHSRCIPAHIAVVEVQRQDAAAIAAIHLAARQQAMPYLRLAHPYEDTQAYFAREVVDRSQGPDRLILWTFQRNGRARQFYEGHGFHGIAQTDGDNEESEPDVQYEWRAA